MVDVHTNTGLGSLRAERTDVPEVIVQAIRLAMIIREYKLDPSLGYPNTKHKNLVNILGWAKALFNAIGLDAQEALKLATDKTACNDAKKALGLNNNSFKLITSLISNSNNNKRFLGCRALPLASLPEVSNDGPSKTSHHFCRTSSQRTRHH